MAVADGVVGGRARDGDELGDERNQQPVLWPWQGCGPAAQMADDRYPGQPGTQDFRLVERNTAVEVDKVGS
jgi:hypothetical protein